MGRKPAADTYQPHATDSNGIKTAEEQRFEDFAKVLTRQERCTIPLTVNRGATATVITNFTVAPMMRKVLGGLAV